MSVILDSPTTQTLLGRSTQPEDQSSAHPLGTLMASRFGFTCTPEDRALYHQAAALHFPDGFEGLAPNRITAPWVREVLHIAARCQIAGANPVQVIQDFLQRMELQKSLKDIRPPDSTCQQCGFQFVETSNNPDGFCSDSCQKEYDRQLSGEVEEE